MKFTSVLTTLAALLLGAFTAQANDQPNIILIMADDMGYEALSSNGSESCKSPNLDKLAAKGVRFTNCFSNPICTPSRVKLCLLYTSPSPRDQRGSRMPSSA